MQGLHRRICCRFDRAVARGVDRPYEGPVQLAQTVDALGMGGTNGQVSAVAWDADNNAVVIAADRRSSR